MEKQKIVVFGSAGNLGMYFIDHLLNELNMEKYEIIAVGTREKYPYKFYEGKYIQVDISNEEDFEKLPKDNIYAIGENTCADAKSIIGMTALGIGEEFYLAKTKSCK